MNGRSRWYCATTLLFLCCILAAAKDTDIDKDTDMSSSYTLGVEQESENPEALMIMIARHRQSRGRHANALGREQTSALSNGPEGSSVPGSRFRAGHRRHAAQEGHQRANSRRHVPQQQQQQQQPEMQQQQPQKQPQPEENHHQQQQQQPEPKRDVPGQQAAGTIGGNALKPVNKPVQGTAPHGTPASGEAPAGSSSNSKAHTVRRSSPPTVEAEDDPQYEIVEVIEEVTYADVPAPAQARARAPETKAATPNHAPASSTRGHKTTSSVDHAPSTSAEDGGTETQPHKLSPGPLQRSSAGLLEQLSESFMGDREPRQWQQGPTRGAMNGLIGGLWGWEEEEDREPRRQWARASEDPEREELRARVQARVMEELVQQLVVKSGGVPRPGEFARLMKSVDTLTQRALDTQRAVDMLVDYAGQRRQGHARVERDAGWTGRLE